MSPLLIAPLLLCQVDTTLGGPDRTSLSDRDIILDMTDDQGRVQDEGLAAETGLGQIAGFRYAILARGIDGTFVPAPPGTDFHTGDAFRLEIEPYCDLYLYILARGPTSDRDVVLLPEPGGPHLRVGRGQRIVIPPPEVGQFRFTGPPGTESFRIVASPRPLVALRVRPEGAARGDAARRREAQFAKILEKQAGVPARPGSSLGEVLAARRADPESSVRACTFREILHSHAARLSSRSAAA